MGILIYGINLFRANKLEFKGEVSMRKARQNNDISIIVLCIFAVLFCCGNAWAKSSEWIFKVSSAGMVKPPVCAKIEMPQCVDGLSIEAALKMVSAPEWLDRFRVVGADVRVEISQGVYRIQTPLKVGWGSDLKLLGTLSISGSAGGGAIISGARMLSGFKLVKSGADLMRLPVMARGNVYSVNVSGVPGLNPGVPIERGFARAIVPVAAELFFRGQVLPLARWPNQGYGKIRVTTDTTGSDSHKFGIEGRKVVDWAGESDLVADGYFGMDWAEEFIPVASVDAQNDELVLSGTGPRFGFKANQRIRILNALSELDEPGEWYLDRNSGLLYLWPPKPIKDGDVEISLSDTLMQIEGAKNVRVSNLKFEMARGDAITVKNSEGVEIDHSVIRNIGNRAVTFNGGRNSGLRNVLIEQTGEGGAVLMSGNRTTLEPANLYVEQSTIRYFSRLSSTYRPAVVVEGVGNRVVGNVLSDAPHSAIIFGGNDHLIAYNDISRVVLETADAGAIYAGRDWTKRGTIITNNFIHDIGNKNGQSGAMGVYLDDQMSGITLRGNVFARVPYPVFIGGGRDNVVEQNLMVNSSPAIHLDARGLSWQHAMVLDKNSALQKGLDAVPYNSPSYSNRYAHLSSIREDDIGAPKYNIARCNLIVGGKLFDIEKAAESGMEIENNYALGESIFLNKMAMNTRQKISDFQLNRSAADFNKDCWMPLMDGVETFKMFNSGFNPLQ